MHVILKYNVLQTNTTQTVVLGHIQINICIHTYMYNTYKNTHMCTSLYTCTHTHTHTHVYVCNDDQPQQSLTLQEID